MSMPVSFIPSTAPVSPAGAGAGSGTAEGGALFGAVLGGLAPGSRDASGTDRWDDDTESTVDTASAAAGCAPPLAAGIAGLMPGVGDAGTPAPDATGPAPARGPAVVAAPTSAAGSLPLSIVDNVIPQVALAAAPTGIGPTGSVPTGTAPAGAVPALLPGATPVATPAGASPAELPAAASAAAYASATTVDPAAAATAPAAPAVAAILPHPTRPVGQPVPASTVDSATAPATVDGTGAVAPAATTADRSPAGDTGPDTGSGRQPDAAALTPAALATRADSALTPLTATAPAAQPAQGQQAPPLPPAAQLALKLAPLRSGPDGTHQVTILLNPEELGPVSVVAQVKGDQLSVQLTGTTGVGADALRDALPQLEQNLRDSGFTTLSLDVRETPRLDAAPRPAWAGGPAAVPTRSVDSATDKATVGTATTTSAAKTESQPIGPAHHLDGQNNRPTARPEQLGTGMYNAAGQVVTAGQPATGNMTGQHSQHHGAHQQPGNQLNLGQPGGNSHSGTHSGGDHAGRYGTATDNGRPGSGHNGGTDRIGGRPERGEREQPAAEPRPTTDRTVTRSVDLRV